MAVFCFDEVHVTHLFSVLCCVVYVFGLSILVYLFDFL